MKFKNMQVLNDVVLDYSNPFKMYKLALEYDSLKQGAAAFGWYLRAADFVTGSSDEELELQYKCLIKGAMIFARSEARNETSKGLIKLAMAVLPNRPEAYYFASRWAIDQSKFRNALMYAKIALSQNEEHEPIEDLKDYPGRVGLKYCYAVSKWKSDGRDDSKNLLFDLKYKEKLNLTKEMSDSVNGWLGQIGYPSTILYTKEEKSKYRFTFEGIDKIDKNYSRHIQDMFVLSLLTGKTDGSFIEIGSGHPTLFNNTFLLEDKFNWKGISLDYSERMCSKFSRERKTNIVFADALNVDYSQLFKQNCIEQRVDYLRINADSASYKVLESIPYHKYEFSTIQFQHNACWWGEEVRNASREFPKKIGYILCVSGVGIDEEHAYEDWWIHPGLINNRMQSSKSFNFAWQYMMKERK